MQNIFICEPGYEARVEQVSRIACRKLVTDMHYNARIQAVVDYNATHHHIKVSKTKARNMRLRQEQHLQVNIAY